MRDIDPEGRRLPIKLDSTSNGEFEPVSLGAVNRAAKRLAHEAASDNAKRRGLARRRFLTSACGAASTLLAFNAANAAAGRTGGYFDLSGEAALDEALARVQVGAAKDEFIFDVQGHFIDTPKGNAKSAEVFVKDVFMDSDTDVMVLSFVPSPREAEPVTIQAADAMRRVVEKLEGTHRLLLHGRVNPNQAGDIEAMDELAERVPSPNEPAVGLVEDDVRVVEQDVHQAPVVEEVEHSQAPQQHVVPPARERVRFGVCNSPSLDSLSTLRSVNAVEVKAVSLPLLARDVVVKAVCVTTGALSSISLPVWTMALMCASPVKVRLAHVVARRATCM